MSIKMTLDPQIARQFINIIGAIVDEFRLRINKDGWKVSAMDPAKVVLIDIDLPKDNFQSYEFGSDNWTSSIDGHPTGVLEDNIAVGIDVDKFKEFFGGMGKKAEIVLHEELHAPVEFIFSMAPAKYYGKYQVELKQGMFTRKMLLLLETEIRKAPKIPELRLDYEIQLDTLEFQRILIKAEKISDYISLGFRREEGGITFIASAIDSDEFPWDATKQLHNWHALSDKARDSSCSLFSLDYLIDIVEVLSSDKVWLHIGQDFPCTILFGLGKSGTVKYWQAPRIESE